MKELVLDGRAEKTNKAKTELSACNPRAAASGKSLRPAPVLTRHASVLPSFHSKTLPHTHSHIIVYGGKTPITYISSY